MNLQRAEGVGGGLGGGGGVRFQTWPRGPPTAPTMPLQITLGGCNLRGAHSPSEDGLRDKRSGGGRPHTCTHAATSPLLSGATGQMQGGDQLRGSARAAAAHLSAFAHVLTA